MGVALAAKPGGGVLAPLNGGPGKGKGFIVRRVEYWLDRPTLPEPPGWLDTVGWKVEAVRKSPYSSCN